MGGTEEAHLVPPLSALGVTLLPEWAAELVGRQYQELWPHEAGGSSNEPRCPQAKSVTYQQPLCLRHLPGPSRLRGTAEGVGG